MNKPDVRADALDAPSGEGKRGNTGKGSDVAHDVIMANAERAMASALMRLTKGQKSPNRFTRTAVRADALDASAVENEVPSNVPKVLKSTPGSALDKARRAVRFGILPNEADDNASSVLGSEVSSGAAPSGSVRADALDPPEDIAAREDLRRLRVWQGATMSCARNP